MCPRRAGSADDPRRPARRGRRSRSIPPPTPGPVGAPDLRRTRLSHWRSDGTAKTRFASEADAHRYALQVRLEHGRDVSVYPCEFCGGWHLGGRAE